MQTCTRMLVLVNFLWLAAAGPAPAATFCVTNQNQLLDALSAASASDEDDTIRFGTSDIHLTTSQINPLIRGKLSLLGGYSSNCLLLLGSSSTTTFTQTGLSLFQLRLRDADLTMSRLHFVAFPSIRIGDSAHTSTFATGRILIQRLIIRDGGDGLNIYSNHHHVRIENSISARNHEPIGTAIGNGISLNRGSGALIDVELINNTIADNKFGIVLVSDGNLEANIYLYNNVAYDNEQFDLTSEYLLLASRNLWGSELFAPGAGLVALSDSNLRIDPQFDRDYDPVEPGSPLINSGNNEPRGGLPSLDVNGSPRQIGSRVDRGAIESGINDVSIFTVTNINDSGAGSMRQAMIGANQSSDASEIRFNISGTCPRVIAPNVPLPVLSSSTSVLGYSQSGSTRNQLEHAFDGTLCVVVNGGGSVLTGLEFATDTDETMLVEGIAFYGFTNQAVLIRGTGRGIVRGNAFGTGAPGLLAPGFGDAAIRVQNAPGSLIGGVDVAALNVISRAAQVGVHLGASTGGRQVRGNLIGFNLAASSALGNGIGIHVQDSTGDDITANVIGNSITHGILINGTIRPPNDMRITANYIGLSPAAFGAAIAAGNGANGLHVESGSSLNVGGNFISRSGQDGVAVGSAARRVALVGNRFRFNAQQAIDLAPDGVNPIDLDVGATGANDSQNYPTLASASGSASVGTVTGTLESANGSYVIRVYRNEDCDADGFGEAHRYVGETVVTINNAGPASNGVGSFSATVNVDGESFLDGVITAIATSSQGNTSEVSRCISYSPSPVIFSDGFE